MSTRTRLLIGLFLGFMNIGCSAMEEGFSEGQQLILTCEEAREKINATYVGPCIYDGVIIVASGSYRLKQKSRYKQLCGDRDPLSCIFKIDKQNYQKYCKRYETPQRCVERALKEDKELYLVPIELVDASDD